jgi:polyribonucleotide nucleotidyltransferase
VLKKKSHEHSQKKKKIESNTRVKKSTTERAERTENNDENFEKRFFSSTNKKVKKKDCSFAETFGAAKDNALFEDSFDFLEETTGWCVGGGSFFLRFSSSEKANAREFVRKKIILLVLIRIMFMSCHPGTTSRMMGATSASTSSSQKCVFADRRRREFSSIGERKRRIRRVSVRGGHCDVDDGYVGGSAVRHPKSVTVKLGESSIKIETQKVGAQANGAVVCTEGETVLYSTVCAARELSADGGWVPLTVNYTERFSAAGKFSGGFKKRDGTLKEGETLKSRIVDRPIRPLIPKGFGYETQILEWVLSYDNERTTDALAICAASAALAVSDVPMKTPVMGCRVGYIDGKFVANPTKSEMEQSRLDLVMAGTKEAVLMIEGFGDFLTTEEMISGIACGQEEIARAAKEIEAWAKEVGKEKMGGDMLIQTPEGIDEKVQALVAEDLKEAMLIPIKKVRGKAIGELRQKAVDALKKDENGENGFDSAQVVQACGRIESAALREAIRTNGRRQDGRKLTHIRPIVAECGVLPRTHGSALFTRGETQCYSVATLGGKSDGQRVDDALEDTDDKRFMLHYFFPPSSVGECGRVGGANRREIGHGNLAERALLPIIPNDDDFPFTIKIESTVTESNGSSSMATVCGGCLALQDAGVPIKR